MATYWGVVDAWAALKRLKALGGAPDVEIQDVGQGILFASVLDPFGNSCGIIENSNFKLN